LAAGQAAPLVVHSENSLQFNVTWTNDEDDEGACTGSAKSGTGPDGNLSLREAVCEANNNAVASTVNINAGTYSLTSLETGELQVGNNGGYSLSIAGGGTSSNTIIQQTDGHDRIIEIDPNFVGDVNVTISNVTLQNGLCTTGIDCTYGGSAILGGGPSPGNNLTLTNVVENGNTAGYASLGEVGGAMDLTDSGTYNFTNSTFTNNTAVYHGGTQLGGGPGGAVYVEVNANAGNVTITNCHLHGQHVTMGWGRGSLQLDAKWQLNHHQWQHVHRQQCVRWRE